MSTMLEGDNGAYVVSTLINQGKQRKIPRGRVLVFSEDFVAVQEEATKQATEARRLFGVPAVKEEPVV